VGAGDLEEGAAFLETEESHSARRLSSARG
jgi:hypothetical protein